MPYRLGENASPTHSPPIGITPSSQTGTPTSLSQQPAYSLPAGLIRPQPQLPQNAISAMVAAACNQVSNGSPTTAQALLHHHLTAQQQQQQQQQQSTQISPLRIRINSPTRINSTSSSTSQASSDHIITTTSSSSPTVPGATVLQKHPLHIFNGSHLARMSQLSQLHRPFESPSPTPATAASQTRNNAKES